MVRNKSGVEGRVRIRKKIGGAVQAVGTIRLGVRVDAVAARATVKISLTSLAKLNFTFTLCNRGRPCGPSGGRRADAAYAFSREPRDVGAPRAVHQIRKQLGQADAHCTEFCTLEMSSADGSDLHAHDGQFAAGPARYNSVMRGCKTTHSLAHKVYSLASTTRIQRCWAKCTAWPLEFAGDKLHRNQTGRNRP